MGRFGSLDGFGKKNIDETHETEEERLEREYQEALDRLYEERQRMIERSRPHHTSIDGDWIRKHEVDEIPSLGLYDEPKKEDDPFALDEDDLLPLGDYPNDPLVVEDDPFTLGDYKKEPLTTEDDPFLYDLDYDLDDLRLIAPDKISDDLIVYEIQRLFQIIDISLLFESRDNPYEELFELLKKRFESLDKESFNAESYRDLYKNVYELTEKVCYKPDNKRGLDL